MNSLIKLPFVATLLVVISCTPTRPSINIAEQLKLAEAGDPIAQQILGAAYFSAIDTKKDMKKSILWYTKSAEQGNAESQIVLGEIYQEGNSVPQDLKKAVSWYTKAAKQDHPIGQYDLALCFLNGQGVNQDNSMAIYWLEKSAENGFVLSIAYLGDLYAKGTSVTKNLVEAYKWLDLARFYTQTISDKNLKWRVRGQLTEVKKNMTRDQILEGERLSNQWDKKYRLSNNN